MTSETMDDWRIFRLHDGSDHWMVGPSEEAVLREGLETYSIGEDGEGVDVEALPTDADFAVSYPDDPPEELGAPEGARVEVVDGCSRIVASPAVWIEWAQKDNPGGLAVYLACSEC